MSRPASSLRPFVCGVEKVLAAYDLRPEDVCIEVTESTLIDAVEHRGRLHELKDLGVSSPSTNFGTGVQPQLPRRFPFDIVKIDQSFVAAGHNTVIRSWSRRHRPRPWPN